MCSSCDLIDAATAYPVIRYLALQLDEIYLVIASFMREMHAYFLCCKIHKFCMRCRLSCTGNQKEGTGIIKVN